jgi:hypothetical protein
MIISPTSRWKKVSSKCCFTISNGIAKLTCKIYTSSTNVFGTYSTIPMSDMWSNLETNLVWVGTLMVHIKNRSSSIANITSFFHQIFQNGNRNKLGFMVFWFEHLIS